MADNITLPGVGEIVATDQITRDSVLQHFQILKLALGAENTFDGYLTFGQAAMAASLPVVIASNQSAVSISGTVTANAGTNLNTSALALESGGNLAAIRTAIEIIDDWDESDRAKVNPIAGQAGVQGGSGVVSANTQRVVLATDVALPAGSNNIGIVAISDVIPGVAATNLGKAIDSVAGATDTGVAMLAVEDASLGATTTADGDWAPLRTTARGALWCSVDEFPAFDDVTGVANSPISTPGLRILGSDGTLHRLLKTDTSGELQVDVLTLPAITGTVTANAGTGNFTVVNGGTFAVQESGAALTALQLIDNIVLAEDAAHGSGNPGVQMLAVRQSSPANLSDTNGDYEPLQVNAGRLWTSSTIDAALPAGTNNIGDVDVLTLPSIPAGTNNIGDVDVLTLPSIPAGTNNIGDVDVLTLPATSLAAGNLVHIDYDTGGGTQNIPMVGMALPASGGSVAGGTSTNPIRVDPTGTTTQPVSIAATVTVDSELPAAVSLADNTSNPTVPGVGSFLMLWDGTNWDRALKGTSASDNVNTTNFNGLVVLSGNYVYDGSGWDKQRGSAEGGTWVQGNVAHDTADTDNPVKIGGKGFSLAPTTTAVEVGPTAVSANDRTDLMTGLKGELTEHPLGVFHTLSNVSTTYNTTSTETQTSQEIDSYKYRKATLGLTIDSTGSPTDIQIIVEISLDGTTFFELKNGALGQWIYDDTYVATAKSIAYMFDIACRKIRIKITATGLLDTTNEFIVSNACLYLSN